VTIGGASGQWSGKFIYYVSFHLVSSTTLRVYLNYDGGTSQYDITASTAVLQFAVNVTKIK